MMVLSEFPNHDSAKVAIAGVAYLGLAGPLIIIRDKHIVGGAVAIDGEVCRLGVRVPTIKSRLIVRRHDTIVRKLGHRGRGCPRLPREGGTASRRTRAAAPNGAVEREPDGQFARGDSGREDTVHHTVG